VVMKRKYYDVRLNGEVIATRFTFNAAVNSGVVSHVRGRAAATGFQYSLTDWTNEKVRPSDEHLYDDELIGATRTWESPKETLTYTIELRKKGE